MSQLALLGGKPALAEAYPELFAWPIVTPAMESAVLDVLRQGTMSGTALTKEFERGYAEWMGVDYALASVNGTASILEALWALGIGAGDEVICPSATYWASALPVFSLGAKVVFADIEPDTLCLDPASVEAHITPRTRAVVVVHHVAHPADMDPLMEVARRHKLKVLEDVSHAQGGLYKGRYLGTFGDVGVCSLMTGKSFAIGEGGIFYTRDREIYERGLLWGHYERLGEIKALKLPEEVGALPWGGVKGRLNQMASAIGLVQLQKYPAEMAEIEEANYYFSQAITRLPGLGMHYPRWEKSNKAGWYGARLFYHGDELGGLSAKRFAEALSAEGVGASAGGNRPLHQCGLLQSTDVYHSGQPTNLTAFNGESLPVTEAYNNRVIHIRPFKRFRREIIDLHIAAVAKVVEQHRELLAGDSREAASGAFSFTGH